MKTKILAFFCIIFAFGTTAFSQPVRTERLVTVRWYVPCVGEYISGQVIFYVTVWPDQDGSVTPPSKQQVKYEGTLIGMKSRKEYTIDFIANSEFHDDVTLITTFTRTILIRLDGKLIARIPMKAHRTVNANGEETVDFNFSEVDCK